MINDYHLMLLPRLIREKIPNASIGFFLHVTFPSSEIVRYQQDTTNETSPFPLCSSDALLLVNIF